MHIVRNEALCLSFLLTKGSTVMLGMLPTKDRKSADMLRNAAESQPCLCRTMLIDQEDASAEPQKLKGAIYFSLKYGYC